MKAVVGELQGNGAADKSFGYSTDDFDTSEAQVDDYGPQPRRSDVVVPTTGLHDMSTSTGEIAMTTSFAIQVHAENSTRDDENYSTDAFDASESHVDHASPSTPTTAGVIDTSVGATLREAFDDSGANKHPAVVASRVRHHSTEVFDDSQPTDRPAAEDNASSFDTLFFRLVSDARHSPVHVYEADCDTISSQKVALVQANPSAFFGSNGHITTSDKTSLSATVHHEHNGTASTYSAFACDLGNIPMLQNQLTAYGLDPSLPTLVLAECVLCLLPCSDPDLMMEFRRVAGLEPFDEFEDWILTNHHYGVLVATNQIILQNGASKERPASAALEAVLKWPATAASLMGTTTSHQLFSSIIVTIRPFQVGDERDVRRIFEAGHLPTSSKSV
ncbi:hypothetical protein DYB32_010092, partial [Aphanomyces invadans]